MFLSPLALIGLGLLVLPIVIHTLTRRRAKRLDFPALEFVTETPSFRLHPRQIQNPLLLLLRLAAIVLIVLALARPEFLRISNLSNVRVILLDCSFSMGVPGRVENAKQAARSIIEKLGPREKASIITFSTDTTELCPFTTDKNRLLTSLQNYRVDGARADFDQVFERVEMQFQPVPHGDATVDLISDFQLADLNQSRDEKTIFRRFRLNTITVGEPYSRNSFIAGASFKSNGDKLEAKATEILVDADGRKGTIRDLGADPKIGSDSGLTFKTESNGQITGSITAGAPDDFDLDDIRYFGLIRLPNRRALVVESNTESDLYFTAALEAAGNKSTPVVVDRKPALPEVRELAAYQLVIYTLRDRISESDIRKLEEYTSDGGDVWLQVGQAFDTSSISSEMTDGDHGLFPFRSIRRTGPESGAHFGSIDESAPELSGVGSDARSGLRSITSKQAFEISGRDDTNVLARWSNGQPCFVDRATGKGKVLFWSISLERQDTNLGANAVFPILVSSVFEDAFERNQSSSMDIGAPIFLSIAADMQVTVETQGMPLKTGLARDLLQHPLHFVSMPGIYHFRYSGGERFIAFNAPASESERELASASDLTSVFGDSSLGTAEPANGMRPTSTVMDSWWRLLMACGFLLVAAETFVWIRKRRALNRGGVLAREDLI